MKRSPLQGATDELQRTLLILLADKINKAILDRKMYKEISKTICEIEDRYKKNEMDIHAPQEVVNYMVKTYALNGGKDPIFSTQKFYDSQKGQQLLESFKNNNCFTSEEEIRMLNIFGLLPGQKGAWNYDEETLKEVLQRKELNLEEVAKENLPHQELKGYRLSEFKEVIHKLTPFMCEFDRMLYERNADVLVSKTFFQDLRSDKKAIYDKIKNTLLNSLSEDEKITLANHRDALQYETDERGNKRMRSVLSVALTEARNFSSLASYSLNKYEGQSEISKCLADFGRKYGNAVENMNEKYHFNIFGDRFTAKELHNLGTTKGNIERADKIQEENSCKIEYDAKLTNLEDIKKFGKEQLEVISKDLTHENLNLDDAICRLSDLRKSGILRLYEKEIKDVNKTVEELMKDISDGNLKRIFLLCQTAAADKGFITNVEEISSKDLNEITSAHRKISEQAKLNKAQASIETQKNKTESAIEKFDSEQQKIMSKLQNKRNQLILEKKDALYAQRNLDPTYASTTLKINTITRTYDEQINTIDKFLNSTAFELEDIATKNAYAIVAASIEENADRIDDIIKHASTSELKNIMNCIEEANNLGICEDACNFITEEIKTYRSEDITYTDDGKFVVEERTQEDVLERTITEEN